MLSIETAVRVQEANGQIRSEGAAQVETRGHTHFVWENMIIKD